MSAAAARAELAAIGRDLVALSGDPGELRAAALLVPMSPRATVCFADLTAAPDWLRLPREEQRELARRVALLAMAPRLATSIDGAWLGELAAIAGEEEIDWAIAQAGDLPADGLSAIPVPDLEAAGFSLMRAALPEALAGYLDWAAKRHFRVQTPVCPEPVEAPYFFLEGEGQGFDKLSPNGGLSRKAKSFAAFCVARAAEREA